MSLIQGTGGGLGGAGSPGGPLAGGAPLGSHAINQSLRFNQGDTPYLTRTPSSAGNQRTWTWSGWVKRSTLGNDYFTLFSAKDASLGNYFWIQFTSTDDDQLRIYNYPAGDNFKLDTNQLFRDVGGWYHFVVAVDTTDTTSTERIKVYVNGDRITSFDAASYPVKDYETAVNRTNIHNIGSYNNGTYDFDGYMAEVNFIDGTALDANSFGETIGGVWVPKEYSGSYGTNGFYLPFGQDTANGASAFFDQDDNGFIAWTDPGTEYEIGASDDYTLELFFNPTSTEMSGASYIAGYYRTTSPSGFFAIELSLSNNLVYLYYGNGASNNFSFTAGDVVAGQWHHLAFNRSSGNLRCFLDGAQKGSTQSSNTRTHNIPEFRVNKAHATSNVTFDGYISNVRLVIGSAVYADGASITVPTSTLTAVTNTKILACTTTTLTEDASSNNVTGTVTSSIASSLSPFADFNFYDDTSGNTNNFTANNLAASDVVPDSPTNNWATNNGAMRANITQSEGNLKMVGVGNNYDNMASTFEIDAEDTDGWYWEYRSIGNDTATGVGIAVSNNQYFNQSDSANPFAHENEAGNVHYQGDGNKRVSGGSATSYGNSWTAGDIIGIAVKAGAVYFYKNGTIQNSGTAAQTGITGKIVPAFAINGTNSGTANYGQDSTFAGAVTAGGNSDANGLGDFKYSVPSGYKSLCSANLPELTIGPNSTEQADDYFSTVLYTGDGSSSNAITGVGFQPDWTWIKTRNGSASHALFDSVRGADNVLRTNGTDAENATAISTASFGGLTSFDSDGFTVDDGTDGTFDATNGSSDTYVAWNWKAGGTAPTKTYKVVVDNDGANKYRFRNSANSATFATYAPTIELQEGGTYVFDWSDDGTNGAVSAQGHPIRFSTTSNGTWGGGTEYTVGVVKDDSAYTTTITVAAGAPTLYYYCQNHSGMGGQANTGTGGSSNFDGSIQSVVSAAPDAGFSIVSYTGTGANATVGHGLSSAPELYIVKGRAASNWSVYHSGTASDAETDFLILNSTADATDLNTYWNDTAPTSSVFSLGTDSNVNGITATFIAYCFHSVDGFSKIGKYTGNNSADGTFVYTGFRPAWIMTKRTDTTSNWLVIDVKRDIDNVAHNRLIPNKSNTEATSVVATMDILSNGFKRKDTNADVNANNGDYIYLAFAEQPFKYANAR